MYYIKPENPPSDYVPWEISADTFLIKVTRNVLARLLSGGCLWSRVNGERCSAKPGSLVSMRWWNSGKAQIKGQRLTCQSLGRCNYHDSQQDCKEIKARKPQGSRAVLFLGVRDVNGQWERRLPVWSKATKRRWVEGRLQWESVIISHQIFRPGASFRDLI